MTYLWHTLVFVMRGLLGCASVFPGRGLRNILSYGGVISAQCGFHQHHSSEYKTKRFVKQELEKKRSRKLLPSALHSVSREQLILKINNFFILSSPLVLVKFEKEHFVLQVKARKSDCLYYFSSFQVALALSGFLSIPEPLLPTNWLQKNRAGERVVGLVLSAVS